MSCEPIIKDGKVAGFMCTRSRNKAKALPCYKCGKPATKLCDFRDYGTEKWKDDYGRERTREWAALDTCHRPMCDECANHVGEDTDFCDEHNNELSLYKTIKAERVHKEQLKELGISE